jgi:hypothetical protein
MPKDNYPLHPDQAQPYYMTIPVEEYENLKDEISHLRSLNEAMSAELERRGVIVVPPSSELDKFEKEWVEAERKNPTPIITFNLF